MAGQIRITPEQMNQRSQQYLKEAEEVNSVIRKMDSLLQALQGEWEGAASEAYAARFAQLRPGFVKMEELIREIASALVAAAARLSDTDAFLAGKFRG